jgi:hypothetical protein
VIRSLPVVVFAMSLMVPTTVSFCQAPHASSGPEHELDEMTKRYKLERRQKTEIKMILESRAQDLQAIFSDSDLSPDQREHRSKELRRVCNQEIEAVLHEEQRQLFDHDQK